MEHYKYVPRIEVFWENHVVSRDVAEYRSSWKTYWTTHVANTLISWHIQVVEYCIYLSWYSVSSQAAYLK